MPPSVLRISLQGDKSKSFKLWLPLFLLWPIAIILYLVFLPLFFIFAFLRFVFTGVYFPVGKFSVRLYLFLCAFKGFEVMVNGKKSKVEFFIK
jgi:hypothetical protein